jgi:hypothetical protein
MKLKSFSFRKRWRNILDVTLLWIYIINFFYKCQHVISVPTLLYYTGENKPVLAYTPIFSLLSKVKGCQFSTQLATVYTIKGTVQRELRGVKIGINRTARINCIAGKCHLPCPKGHHHERSLNVIGGCSTF